MTLNRELFVKDPLTFVIPNDGVSKIGRPDDDKQWDVLRYELTSFVCEGEYARGLQRILDSYVSNLPRATQPAVWVSGFYGSGKSHLVRVLEHVWADTRLPDGATARGLVALDTHPHITDSLRELTTQATRIGAAPWSAAGTLEAANVDQLNLAFLAIVLRAAGLPDKVAPARLRLWLREEGIEDAVVAAIAGDGRDVDRELRGFHLSVPLAQAVLAERPALADSPAALLQQFKAQFPDAATFDTTETVGLLREVLEGVGGGTVPPTLIVLDEVQQYINEDGDRAMAVQHMVQAISSQFEGRVLLVATGQQDLTATAVLQKLQDRFSVKAHLENQDVDQVVRRVLLQKEPARIAELENVIDRARGEVSRELAGSRLGHRAADDEVLAADYPLLPARRRFWDQVLRVADAGGRAGQLRSQLRVVHEANRRAGDRPVGTVVGADFLYDEKHSDMNQSGRLLKETQLLIAEQAQHTDDGELRGRILGVIHLISLLPTGGAADTGVRPTAEHIADLLVEDLVQDGHRLRQRVPELLATLAKDGVVQQHGDEFRLQTVEGREWEQEFSRRRAALSADAAAVGAERDRLLREAVQAHVPARVPQGKVKEQRRLAFQDGDTEPQVIDAVPVWVRSEWDGVTRKQFADLARGAGQASPLVFVHLAKVRSDELRDAVLDLAASREVIDTRPNPATDEGRDARAAMTSRTTAAKARADGIVADVLAGATVELAGGALMNGVTLRERIEAAAARAVERLYPDFGTADDARWATAVKHLSEGNKEPLQRLGWDGPVETHPAVKKVYDQVGASWVSGKVLFDTFAGTPYGWQGDALRGVIGALVAGGHITAQINSNDADARKIMALGVRLGPLQVRRESVVIDKVTEIRARSLLSKLGHVVTADPLPGQISQALAAVAAHAAVLSGPPPMPQVTVPEAIAEITRQTGNAQVLALVQAGGDATAFAERLDALETRRPARTSALDTARRLASAGSSLDSTAAVRARLTAFEAGRELLAETDGVTPILQDLTAAVRAAVADAAERHEAARSEAVRVVEAEPAWSELDVERRGELLATAGLQPRPSTDLGDSSAVLAAVIARPPTGWDDAVDSVAVRSGRLRAEIAKVAAPRATVVALPGATVTSEGELNAYLDSVRSRLQDALTTYGAIVVRPS